MVYYGDKSFKHYYLWDHESGVWRTHGQLSTNELTSIKRLLLTLMKWRRADPCWCWQSGVSCPLVAIMSH